MVKRGKATSDITGIMKAYLYLFMTLLSNATYIYLYYIVVDMNILLFCISDIPTRRRRGDDGDPILLSVESVDPTEDEPYGSR